MDLVLRSERVVFRDGLRPAAIRVRNGVVAEIRPHSEKRSPGVRLMDVGRLVVLPGLVDTHVHINEPGRTEWEGFETATRAAAAGGVTTLVDMPLNSIPPTTTRAGLDAKRQAAEGRCHVDVGFWGGVVPGNAGDLAPLARAGVLGFKCFLSPSGVEEFAHVGEADLREALPILATLGLPLLVHAELPSCLFEPCGNPRSYATWLTARPPEAEHAAIDLLIALAREFHVHIHIVHLAAATALPAIAAARQAGVPITVETCPHYLVFAAEEIQDGATALKCAPPIRGRAHGERLWQALAAGQIDLVATDHSPAPANLKHQDTGDFLRAWGGIASLQLGLSAVWTGARRRGVSIEHVARWMAEHPARLARLQHRKGTIEIGHDADLVVWDPDATTTVDAATLFHRHPVTPYHGARLHGRVQTTLVRGEVVFDEGECRGRASGRLIAQTNE
jgi:allantoinase